MRKNGLAWTTVFAALLIVSGYLNLRLVQRIVELRAAGSKPTAVRVGVPVGQLEVESVDGARVSLVFSTPTVLYVFSPHCTWTRRNERSIASLATQRRSSYRFVGVSPGTDGLKQYVGEKRIEFEAYGGLPESAARAFKFGVTPTTVVLDGQGRIVTAWQGAYTGQIQRDIETFFGVVLPRVPNGVVESQR